MLGVLGNNSQSHPDIRISSPSLDTELANPLRFADNTDPNVHVPNTISAPINALPNFSQFLSYEIWQSGQA